MIRIPLFSSSLMLRQCWNGQEPSEDPVLCHQNSLQGWLWWKRISCIWKTLQFTLSSILPHLVSCNSHNSEEETYSSVNEILYSNLAQINIPISPASLSWNKKSYCQCEKQECQQAETYWNMNTNTTSHFIREINSHCFSEKTGTLVGWGAQCLVLGLLSHSDLVQTLAGKLCDRRFIHFLCTSVSSHSNWDKIIVPTSHRELNQSNLLLNLVSLLFSNWALLGRC